MQKTDYSTSQEQTAPIGLFSGKMGIALYHFHYARIYKDEIQEEKALTLIGEIQEEIHADTPYGYAEGLAGIGSALCYLFREGFIKPDDEDFFSDFDTFFFRKVYLGMHTDLSRATGLIGIGYYLLNRIKDTPIDDNMPSLQLRNLLLLVQDVLFAYLGMNGYTYPFLESTSLPESVIVDVKRFLDQMLKTGICPELTRQAITIMGDTRHLEQTVFAELEDAYNNNNMQGFSDLLKKTAESTDLPEDSLARLLANLQIQHMSLPAWWELF